LNTETQEGEVSIHKRIENVRIKRYWSNDSLSLKQNESIPY